MMNPSSSFLPPNIFLQPFLCPNPLERTGVVDPDHALLLAKAQALLIHLQNLLAAKQQQWVQEQSPPQQNQTLFDLFPIDLRGDASDFDSYYYVSAAADSRFAGLQHADESLHRRSSQNTIVHDMIEKQIQQIEYLINVDRVFKYLQKGAAAAAAADEILRIVESDPSLAFGIGKLDNDAECMSVFHAAVKCSDTLLVRRLYELQPSQFLRRKLVDSRHRLTCYNALHDAIVEDNFEMCRVLVKDCEADVRVPVLEQPDLTPAVLSFRVSSDITHLFIENGAGRKVTLALQFAAANNDLESIKRLLAKGAFVNEQDERYNLYTALHVAAEKGHVAACELLLAEGADISMGDCRDSTPLHVAAEAGHTKVCELLLKHKAIIDPQNWYGEIPLDLAIINSKNDVCSLLLAHGSRLSRFALEDSLCRYNPQTIRILHEAGADLNKMVDDEDAEEEVRHLEHAISNEHQDEALLMFSLGAGDNERSDF